MAKVVGSDQLIDGGCVALVNDLLNVPADERLVVFGVQWLLSPVYPHCRQERGSFRRNPFSILSYLSNENLRKRWRQAWQRKG
jgi:hypothetical protein